jgi:hypothetical protein
MQFNLKAAIEPQSRKGREGKQLDKRIVSHPKGDCKIVKNLLISLRTLVCQAKPG